MSSSSDRARVDGAVLVVDGERAADLRPVPVPELPTGPWTRLGERAVHGDPVTEEALEGLAGSTRSAARAQGYAVGWAEGRRAALLEARAKEAEREERAAAAERRREAEHARAMTALAEAARSLQELAASVAAQVEDSALALARELTEVLVGRELRTTADPAGDAVRRALALLPEDRGPLPVTLRLHPSVAAAADTDALRARGVHVAPDASLDLPDAVAETADAVVDGRVAAALQRVREVLS